MKFPFLFVFGWPFKASSPQPQPIQNKETILTPSSSPPTSSASASASSSTRSNQIKTNNNHKKPPTLSDVLLAVWELQQNSNAISKTNQNFNEDWEQLGYLSQNGNQKKGQNTIQERLKYLWLVIIDYAKTCTPEHEQQIIVAFRDTYFKRLLQGIESAIESRYTPETVKIGLTNTKAFLEFVCFASFNGKGAIKDSSSNNILERKGSIFFIEDDED
jgi:hypothetical protein